MAAFEVLPGVPLNQCLEVCPLVPEGALKGANAEPRHASKHYPSDPENRRPVHPCSLSPAL